MLRQDRLGGGAVAESAEFQPDRLGGAGLAERRVELNHRADRTLLDEPADVGVAVDECAATTAAVRPGFDRTGVPPLCFELGDEGDRDRILHGRRLAGQAGVTVFEDPQPQLRVDRFHQCPSVRKRIFSRQTRLCHNQISNALDTPAIRDCKTL